MPKHREFRRGRREAHREDTDVTTIKASCPTCGEVELTSEDVTLMVCSHASQSYYTFDCPKCADEVRKPADDHVVSLLMSGGVRAEVWELPAEALETHAGPALTYDDLLDFALQLNSADDLAAVAAQVTAPH
ncbi:MAG: hypothetical protein QOE45_2468 [Frankiaceae bacterium]|jgi:predicted RNA-binding Zn-ribbon protein involved in translation (DUF1610 family)|nr:hypothetical protein [Frankiaceae bacterium]